MKSKFKPNKMITIVASVIAIIALTGTASLYAGSTIFKETKIISIMLDQKQVNVKSPPIIMKGRVLFPARDTFDAMGVRFSFNKGSLIATYKDVKIEGAVDSTVITKGSQTFKLPVPPIILEGKLHIPSQFLALVLDRDVSYDSANRQVSFGYEESSISNFEVLLYEAARNGDSSTIKTMINRGVNVNVILEDQYGANSALDYAILNNHTEAARVLIEHGGSYAPERVWMVVQARNGKLMELLLSNGLDPNISIQGSTLLTVASGRIHAMEPDGTETIITPSIQIVNLLLEYGADPSQDGSLMSAIQSSNYEITQALLRHGANPYHVDSSGNTAYQAASQYGITEWLNLQSSRTIPIVSIQHRDGTPLLQGTLYLGAKPGFLGKSVHWGGEEVYIDVPDGEYQLHHVVHRGSSYLFSDNMMLRMEQGLANPDHIQLPKVNVTGTLVGADKGQQNGFLPMEDVNGNHLLYIELANGQFHLSLPAGTYRFGKYSLSDKKISLTGMTQFTITDSEDVQQLSLSFPFI